MEEESEAMAEASGIVSNALKRKVTLSTSSQHDLSDQLLQMTQNEIPAKRSMIEINVSSEQASTSRVADDDFEIVRTQV